MWCYLTFSPVVPHNENKLTLEMAPTDKLIILLYDTPGLRQNGITSCTCVIISPDASGDILMIQFQETLYSFSCLTERLWKVDFVNLFKFAVISGNRMNLFILAGLPYGKLQIFKFLCYRTSRSHKLYT